MEIQKQNALWQQFDPQTKAELTPLSEAELNERFQGRLTFGTGGMRGKMGAGATRINQYTIACATVGYALFLSSRYGKKDLTKGVIIAYDSRRNSKSYATLAAQVLRDYGIGVSLVKEPAPTPLLSFAVAYRKALGGIMITASHNHKEDNGYKIYNAQGVQLLPEAAEEIAAFIQRVTVSPRHLPNNHMEKIRIEGDPLFDAYCHAVLKGRCRSTPRDCTIIYSPLHGTGYRCLRSVLEERGFSPLYAVPEQALPNGDFPTAPIPNPENLETFALALALGREKNGDLLLVTDADCDRLGVAIGEKDGFIHLNGNEVAALLCDYLLKNDKKEALPPTVITTIVSGTLGADIAKSYGANLLYTLTGFKYIGAAAAHLEETKQGRFLFGYEESCGYLWGSHAKDKDAVAAALLIGEMAAEYKKKGQTLGTALTQLYQKYGYRHSTTLSFAAPTSDFKAWQEKSMAAFSTQSKGLFSEQAMCHDYRQGIAGLPPADVLKYTFEDGSWLALRPSGTEPKMKLYGEFFGATTAKAKQRRDRLLAPLKSQLAQPQKD